MADMADMLKSFSSMMEGKQIPDNIKEMLNSLQNNPSSHSEQPSNGESRDGSEQPMSNIDINTILKMQKIINVMNSPANNSGVNLLRSLKPYLKPSRQAKVDEYIQLFNIEKVFKLMKQSGGDEHGV